MIQRGGVGMGSGGFVQLRVTSAPDLKVSVCCVFAMLPRREHFAGHFLTSGGGGKSRECVQVGSPCRRTLPDSTPSCPVFAGGFDALDYLCLALYARPASASTCSPLLLARRLPAPSPLVLPSARLTVRRHA